MQPFHASGLWYLPNDRDRLVAGTLDFSKDGLRLQLQGTLSESPNLTQPDRYEIVYGVLEGSPLGRFVKANGCLRIRYSLSMPGYSTEELAPTIAFVSSHPLENETLIARQAEIRLSGLDAWAHVGRGIEVKAEDRALQFNYSAPPDMTATIDGSTCALTFLDAWSRKGASFEFQQRSAWVLTFDGQPDIDAVRGDWLPPLQNMISWMRDRPTAVVDLSLILQVHPEYDSDAVHVLYAPIFWGAEEKEDATIPEMLVTLRDFESGFADVLVEWWTFHRRFRRFCDVFFGLQYAPPRFVEMRLAWLLRAVSAFASAHDSFAVSPQETVSDVIDTLAAHFPSRYAHKDALVPVAHELLLPNYLELVVRQQPSLTEALTGKSPAHFIDDILRLRSVMLWGTRGNSVSGQQVFWASERLAMLLKIAVGAQLPTLRPKLEQLCARSAKFSHLIQQSQSTS